MRMDYRSVVSDGDSEEEIFGDNIEIVPFLESGELFINKSVLVEDLKGEFLLREDG